MIGAPTETREEIDATIGYAVHSGLVEANFSITTALPATRLWEMARARGWKLPERSEEFDYYRAARPSAAADEVSLEQLERLRRKAVLMFYLHPKRVGKILGALCSRNGLTRLAVKLARF
jgi:anaerobic magnesium-protoporphyrin IX monomethyl ester cyclase